MRLLWRAALLLSAGLAFFFVAGLYATWAPDLPVAQLAQRWAKAPSQFVPVQGMRVHLRDEGPRDDPRPIVLLHGTSDSLHTWDGWAASLSAQRRVIRFDLPGFGLTGPHPLGDYSIPAYVAFVVAMLDTLGVHELVLGGNSLGGQIAWASALAEPRRVRQLLLVDAAGYAVPAEQLPLAFTLARNPVAGPLLEHVLPRGLVISSLRKVYGDPGRITDALVDRYYDMALRAGNRHALVLRLRAVAKAGAAGQERIAELAVPTLVLWGGMDRLIPLSVGQRFASDISGAQLVVFDRLGHTPHEEDPGATVVPVRQFLGVQP